MPSVQQNIVEELDQGVAVLASDLLAIADGDGDPKSLIAKVRALAQALSDYRNLEGDDPPVEQIIARLRSLKLKG
jgi:hypothetical protein